MNYIDSLNAKNKPYKNDVIEIFRGGIKSKNYHIFIPFASITRIWLGKIPFTINLKTVLGTVLACAGFYVLYFSPISKGKGGTFLGFVAMVGGIYLVIISLKSWYALNIEMASGAVHSFSSDNRDYINDGYECILEVINKREENRENVIFDMSTGKTTFGNPSGDNVP